MKGKMYRPFVSLSELPKEFVQRPKPWVKDQQPRIYMWESSIPEKWIDIKGRQAFQHVSETGNNRNTLDFLETNQKYINTIADPRSKSPSAQGSRIASRVTSPQNTTRMFFHPGKNNKATLSCGSESLLIPNNELISFQVSLPEEKTEDLKTRVHYKIPKNKKNLIKTSSMKNIVLSVPYRPNTGCMTNRFSMPKRLVSMRKNNIQVKKKFRNPVVDEFLKRFEKKKDEFIGVGFRKGLSGCKLVETKKNLC
ncbi:hypothetical protein SteCoe_1307 [Stentor coeruleus]|uniref:Uncharacterized protein n=1 Tax=Stentor coeruleus TaxID=5963 RepID=A0A1R2D297_9CILI|nr:hypothetical protein SteCoe_1307 [Stentor coeruleus]